jgi:hypothetical protein
MSTDEKYVNERHSMTNLLRMADIIKAAHTPEPDRGGGLRCSKCGAMRATYKVHKLGDSPRALCVPRCKGEFEL